MICVSGRRGLDGAIVANAAATDVLAPVQCGHPVQGLIRAVRAPVPFALANLGHALPPAPTEIPAARALLVAALVVKSLLPTPRTRRTLACHSDPHLTACVPLIVRTTARVGATPNTRADRVGEDALARLADAAFSLGDGTGADHDDGFAADIARCSVATPIPSSPATSLNVLPSLRSRRARSRST